MRHRLKLLSGLLVAFAMSGCAGCGSSAQPPQKMHGIDVGPYVNGQSPPDAVSHDQLQTRLELAAPYTQWVRTYGCVSGFEQAGGIAHRLGLKAAVTAWLGDLPGGRQPLQAGDPNLEQINNLKTALANGDVDIAIVGNEAVYAGHLTPQQVLVYIREIKRYVADDLHTDVPVTTAEPLDTLLANPALVAECDVVFANYYPFWQGVTIAKAVDDFATHWRALSVAYPGKKLVVSETGWPAAGATVGGAVPSPENQSRYIRDFVSWARANSVDYFTFEAFDEKWKADPPNPPQEGFWGIFRVQITSAPPLGTVGPVKGRVWGVTPSSARIAVYIYVNGWYNKPTWTNRLTAVQNDGTWQCDLPAPNDKQATIIRAYLVPSDYTDPPKASGEQTIPNESLLLRHSYGLAEKNR